MKKRGFCVLLLLCLLALSACGPTPAAPGSAGPSEPSPDWGLTLAAQDVTSTGMTLVCTQSGGTPTGELQTGSEYTLLRLQNGVWEPLPYVAENVAWTMEAYMIVPGQTSEWTICWEGVYGSLPPGSYRIGKSFQDFRAPGDFDSATFYADFAVAA